jgi:hypothetical protein
MNYEQIRRTVATKRSMKQIETSLPSKLNNVRIDEISDKHAPISPLRCIRLAWE